MWKAALAGALALALGTFSASAQQEWSGNRGYIGGYEESHAQRGPLVTESHIAGLKSALRLTPEQYPYWGPVESALRSLARQQRRDSGAGFVQRMSDRASSVAGTALALRRLASASRPLMRSLSEEQKSSGMQLVRRYGFERLMAAF
jgi:hypothetical protein